MKVKELIEKLEGCDPEAQLVITSSNFEQNGAIVDVTGVHTYRTGKKEMKDFRDAFDGESYSKEVWTLFSEEGNETIIKIY